jgi:phosphatidylinositol alpha-mannosyltransferase
VRIGMISPYSLTLPGGVQGQILGLARTMRAMGHEVRVLGPCDGPPPDAGVTPLGNSVPTAANGSVAPIAPDPSAQLRTIRALRDEDFDVVHLHEPLAPGPTQTAMFFKTGPLLGTFHAAGESAAYKWFSPGVKWLSRRLDLRCAVSEDAEKMARSALGGSYTLLFNGVEVSSFAKATPAPTRAPTIFFIGRHEPRKGLDVLLAAMTDMPANVSLWIAGEGPDTEALRARVAGDVRIEWLGRITDHERAERMRGADVFCAPSLHGESFGVVLLEAMAADTPVVASDLPGYANVARAGRDAILVPPGDPIALAGALLRVLTDPERAAELVKSGEERAGEFSMEHLAERYLELYRQIAAG